MASSDRLMLLLVTGLCTAAVSTIYSDALAWQIPISIKSVQVVGKLIPREGHFGRDVGLTTRVGSRVIWAFADTLEPGVGMLSSTTAWARRRGDILTLNEPDPKLQFFPFTTEELAFNADPPRPACCDAPTPNPTCVPGTDCPKRWALWPEGAVQTASRTATVAFGKYLIRDGYLNYLWDGSGVARAQVNQAQGIRSSNVLFNPDDPYRAGGHFRKDDNRGKWVYLYGGGVVSGQPVDYLVRVHIRNVDNRADYRFYNKNATGCSQDRSLCFVADRTLATPVEVAPIPPGYNLGSPGLRSVSWVNWLRRFVALSEGCVGSDCGYVFFRTAPQPEGPWTAPIGWDLSGVSQATGLMFHPGLSRPGVLTISGRLRHDPPPSGPTQFEVMNVFVR